MKDTKSLGVGKGLKNFGNRLNQQIYKSSPYSTLRNNKEAVAKLNELIKKDAKLIQTKGISTNKIQRDLKEIKEASTAAGEKFSLADQKITKQILEDRSISSYAKAEKEEKHTTTNKNRSLIQPRNIRNNKSAATSISHQLNKPAEPKNISQRQRIFGSAKAAVEAKHTDPETEKDSDTTLPTGPVIDMQI